MAGEVKKTSGKPRVGDGTPGPGRPKGTPNKTTTAIKDMILRALDEAHEDGAVAYLKQQADKNPTAFLTLVGKVLPLQLTGEDGGAIKYQDVTQDAEAVMALVASLTERQQAGVTLQ